MAVERTTVARPYAEAIYQFALRDNSFQRWSDMLSLLAALVTDPVVAGLIDNPNCPREALKNLLLDIAGDRLHREGANLLMLLLENKRLHVAPEIATLFEQRKNEQEGTLDVTIISAYAINKAQETKLAAALQSRLGKAIRLSIQKDPTLIGGLKIRAGDLVIDGSISNKVARLATAFGI
jgi:F-type H+-transporting ATPase subunit delta